MPSHITSELQNPAFSRPIWPPSPALFLESTAQPLHVSGGNANLFLDGAGTNRTLTIPGAGPANAGLYSVTVANSGGAIDTAGATLTVRLFDYGDAPDIDEQGRKCRWSIEPPDKAATRAQ